MRVKNCLVTSLILVVFLTSASIVSGQKSKKAITTKKSITTQKSKLKKSVQTNKKTISEDPFVELEKYLRATYAIDYLCNSNALLAAQYATQLKIPSKIEQLPDSIQSQVHFIREAYNKWGSVYQFLVRPFPKTVTFEEYQRLNEEREGENLFFILNLNKTYDTSVSNLESALNDLKRIIQNAKVKLKRSVQTSDWNKPLENQSTQENRLLNQKFDNLVGKWSLKATENNQAYEITKVSIVKLGDKYFLGLGDEATVLMNIKFENGEFSAKNSVLTEDNQSVITNLNFTINFNSIVGRYYYKGLGKEVNTKFTGTRLP